MNITLIGFMATGKTILGRKLAKELGMEFIDTDYLVEKKEKKKIADIFAMKGEEYFRRVERNIIKDVSWKNNVVISTGGGAVLLRENMERLRRKGIIICLKAKPEVILERVRHQRGIRPLLNKPDPLREIKSILEKRAPYYRQADFSINTSDFDVEKILRQIISKLVNYNNKKH